MNTNQEIIELRVRVKALEARVKNNNEAWAALRRASSGAVERIAALEAGATCPHIVSTDEGTSYCDLAEQTAAAQPASAAALAPAGGLVERVAGAIGQELSPAAEARAAIREVAAWLEDENTDIGMGTAGNIAERLRDEAD